MDRKVYCEKEGDRTKIAVVENGDLTRLFSVADESIDGNIYRGKVINVTTAGCFVDLGETVGFLSGVRRAPGENVIVTVKRNGNGKKKALLDDRILLAGRYVLVTDKPTSAFSSFVSEERKKSLRALAESRFPDDLGVVFRSACEDAGDDEIVDEGQKLFDLCREIGRRGRATTRPECLFRNSAQRIAETLSLDGTVHQFDPEIDSLIGDLDAPVVTRDGVELVFDETEAMTVVDVNDKRNFGAVYDEERVTLQADLIAADFFAEQIRLRNIGGLIAVDFVSVPPELFLKVKERLDAALKKDFVKTTAEYADKACVAIVMRTKRFTP